METKSINSNQNENSLDIQVAEAANTEFIERNLKEELKTTKQKMKFWAITGAILMLISVALAIVVYVFAVKNGPIINNLKENLSSGIASSTISTEQNNKNLIRRLIDGVHVEAGKENIYPFAIMIDNHIDARPQSGLDKAELVIEAEAEGGITRYLAVFASGEHMEKIGPIRSARPYFIDWAAELSAVYVHVGGSPEALAKMIKENTLHINEFYNEDYFWRGSDFAAPHNVFTSSEKLAEYQEKKELVDGKYFEWKFKDDANKEDAGTTTSIAINFILPEYKVQWQYDSENNDYIRFLGGEKHVGADESAITVKNIIVQYVKGEMLDDEKRQSFQHIGEGEAVVCLDGGCNEGIWKKKSAAARTRFYDKDNNEFEFNAGTTWIEVVKPEYEVEY